MDHEYADARSISSCDLVDLSFDMTDHFDYLLLGVGALDPTATVMYAAVDHVHRGAGALGWWYVTNTPSANASPQMTCIRHACVRTCACCVHMFYP